MVEHSAGEMAMAFEATGSGKTAQSPDKMVEALAKLQVDDRDEIRALMAVLSGQIECARADLDGVAKQLAAVIHQENCIEKTHAGLRLSLGSLRAEVQELRQKTVNVKKSNTMLDNVICAHKTELRQLGAARASLKSKFNQDLNKAYRSACKSGQRQPAACVVDSESSLGKLQSSFQLSLLASEVEQATYMLWPELAGAGSQVVEVPDAETLCEKAKELAAFLRDNKPISGDSEAAVGDGSTLEPLTIDRAEWEEMLSLVG